MTSDELKALNVVVSATVLNVLQTALQNHLSQVDRVGQLKNSLLASIHDRLSHEGLSDETLRAIETMQKFYSLDDELKVVDKYLARINKIKKDLT